MQPLRTWAVPILGIIAGVSIVLLANPWVDIGDGQRFVTPIFWLSFLLLLIALFYVTRREPDSARVEVEGPPFASFLFSNSKAGLVWFRDRSAPPIVTDGVPVTAEPIER